MDPFERYKAIAIIVHLMGDMHCPMHIVYLPDNVVKGHYYIEWKNKKHDMHVMWDARIFTAYYDWSFIDMAYLRRTNLKNGILTYHRRKTGQQLSIRWERCIQDILDKYENPTSDYLLPIIRSESKRGDRPILFFYKRVFADTNN